MRCFVNNINNKHKLNSFFRAFIYYFFLYNNKFLNNFFLQVFLYTLFDEHQNYRWKHTHVYYRTINWVANIKYLHAHSKWTLWMSIQWNVVTLKRENWDHFYGFSFKICDFSFNMGLTLRETCFLSFWRFLKFFSIKYFFLYTLVFHTTNKNKYSKKHTIFVLIRISEYKYYYIERCLTLKQNINFS